MELIQSTLKRSRALHRQVVRRRNKPRFSDTKAKMRTIHPMMKSRIQNKNHLWVTKGPEEMIATLISTQMSSLMSTSR